MRVRSPPRCECRTDEISDSIQYVQLKTNRPADDDANRRCDPLRSSNRNVDMPPFFLANEREMMNRSNYAMEVTTCRYD